MLFYRVSPFTLLLYKQLPSKVKIIKIYLNIYFIGLQLYSEGKLYSSTSLYFQTFAFHIEVTLLVDGTYEIIQEPDGDFSSEAQVNLLN